MTITVAAFYKFVPIGDCAALRAAVHEWAKRYEIRGTMLIAREGINATVSGERQAAENFVAELTSDPRFTDLAVKWSTAAAHPFGKLKVKIKSEIVTFGVPNADPSVATGTPVSPQDWNALIQNPHVTVIDTRNDYEVSIGSFPRAIDPGTRAFSELPGCIARTLPADRSKPVAMFCTGGIRCEKASAYLIQLGFTSVFQLEGGILKYLEVVPEAESLWQGDCFVFDGRVGLGPALEVRMQKRCPGCGQPCGRDAHCPPVPSGLTDLWPCWRLGTSLALKRRRGWI
jgi:UPF0176 protein